MQIVPAYPFIARVQEINFNFAFEFNSLQAGANSLEVLVPQLQFVWSGVKLSAFLPKEKQSRVTKDRKWT